MTDKIKKYEQFVVDGNYTIHAQGFNEPVDGKLVEIEVAEDGQILLVMEKSDKSRVTIFIKAVTGWSVNQEAA